MIHLKSTTLNLKNPFPKTIGIFAIYRTDWCQSQFKEKNKFLILCMFPQAQICSVACVIRYRVFKEEADIRPVHSWQIPPSLWSGGPTLPLSTLLSTFLSNFLFVFLSPLAFPMPFPPLFCFCISLSVESMLTSKVFLLGLWETRVSYLWEKTVITGL